MTPSHIKQKAREMLFNMVKNEVWAPVTLIDDIIDLAIAGERERVRERIEGMKKIVAPIPDGYENNNPNYLRLLQNEQDKFAIYNKALTDLSNHLNSKV